jgi:hypothetical protein
MFASKAGSKPTFVESPATKPLEIIVPFTRPDLTQAALDEADRLVGKQNARIRVVAVQVVPTGLPIDRPPVAQNYLKTAIQQMLCRAPVQGEIYLVRNAEHTWARLLPSRSIVMIASHKRWWRTQEERLAQAMRRIGHDVLLVYPQ